MKHGCLKGPQKLKNLDFLSLFYEKLLLFMFISIVLAIKYNRSKVDDFLKKLMIFRKSDDFSPREGKRPSRAPKHPEIGSSWVPSISVHYGTRRPGQNPRWPLPGGGPGEQFGRPEGSFALLEGLLPSWTLKVDDFSKITRVFPGAIDLAVFSVPRQ